METKNTHIQEWIDIFLKKKAVAVEKDREQEKEKILKNKVLETLNTALTQLKEGDQVYVRQGEMKDRVWKLQTIESIATGVDSDSKFGGSIILMNETESHFYGRYTTDMANWIIFPVIESYDVTENLIQSLYSSFLPVVFSMREL